MAVLLLGDHLWWKLCSMWWYLGKTSKQNKKCHIMWIFLNLGKKKVWWPIVAYFSPISQLYIIKINVIFQSFEYGEELTIRAPSYQKVFILDIGLLPLFVRYFVLRASLSDIFFWRKFFLEFPLWFWVFLIWSLGEKITWRTTEARGCYFLSSVYLKSHKTSFNNFGLSWAILGYLGQS